MSWCYPLTKVIIPSCPQGLDFQGALATWNSSLWILVPTHSPTKWTIIWSFLLLSPFGKLFSLSVIISRFVGVEDLQRYHFTKFGCGGIGGRRDNISLSFPLLHKLSTVIIHFILYLIIEYDYILCIFGSNSLFCSLECSKCS